MANLPPRPESPPKLRDERRSIDDRDRDRRSALPMAPSRLTRLLPERERIYVPSRKPDTYIPGGYESRRENDRRDYDSRDRDRDRYRDFDRDRERRAGGRDRDYDRSPRKWETQDRDRRVYDRDRGPYRKPVSPIRRSGPGPSRRDSRSPPRRRLRSRSRSPSYRSRPRSRSRSPRHSPLPSKRIKLGNHSIGGSPRSRSPHRRSRSRGKSLSADKRPPTSAIPPPDSQQAQNAQADIAVIKKEEQHDTKLSEEIPTIKLEKPIQSSSSCVKPSQGLQESKIQEESKLPIPQQPPQPESNEINEGIPSQTNIKIEEIKVEMREGTSPHSPAEPKKSIKMDTTEDVDVKNTEIETPKLTPIISNHPIRSPSPQPSRNVNDHQRANIPTGPQRNWPNRSPPRGPRNYGRPNLAPQNQPPSYPIGRRDSRRPFPVQGQSPFPISLSKAENEVKLPMIPKYDRTKGAAHEISALEVELSKLRGVRVMHAHQDLNQVKALQRAFHELDMASTDLHAAEGRRRVADAQLDKAKTGSLGIDAAEIVDANCMI